MSQQQRAAKSYLSKCQRCNRTQSVVWTKCPHCFYEQLQSKNIIIKRLLQSKVFKSLSDDNDESEKDLNIESNNIDEQIMDMHQQSNNNSKLKIRQSPSRHSHSLVKKRQGLTASKLIQNNMKVENTQNLTNYNFDGQIGKYSIMIIILIIFIGFLFWDLNILRQAQLKETQREINQCEKDYQKHSCDMILNNSELTPGWKQYCINWKVCMEKDIYQDFKILKLITTYFADITNTSIESMNSKVVGIILIVYFFGLAFSHFLGCLCPKRSKS